MLCGWNPITRRYFPREAFPRKDAQQYVSARESQRAETYPCASSRGNASRGKDRGVIGPRPTVCACLEYVLCMDYSEYGARIAYIKVSALETSQQSSFTRAGYNQRSSPYDNPPVRG